MIKFRQENFHSSCLHPIFQIEVPPAHGADIDSIGGIFCSNHIAAINYNIIRGDERLALAWN